MVRNTMIFNAKAGRRSRRINVGDARLTPRLITLLRESWWLLIVAGFCYLGLILASYQRSDPGWSFSGTGEPIHNKGGVVGAWAADLLLYLFGGSAWWLAFAGIVLVVTGYRQLKTEDGERHHPALAIPGFLLVLLSSAALESLRLYHLPVTLPGVPGGALGDFIGQGLAHALGFNGATLVLIALFAAGWSLFTRMSWLRLMERIGGGIEAFVRRTHDPRREAQDH